MILQNSESGTSLLEHPSYIGKVAFRAIDGLLTSLAERLPYIAAGLVVLIVFWIAGRIIRALFLSTSDRAKLDPRLRALFSRLIGIGITLLGIFAALTVIIPNFSFSQLIAGLGFSSFVVGFAAKDILNNLFSGILILWKQPFQIGDYLFVKNIEGEVEYIGVRATRLKMNDGELILVPNGEMYSNPLTIRGAGALQRRKLELFMDYSAKVATAKGLILEALREITDILSEPAPSVFVTDLSKDGIKLNIYFWVDSQKSSPLGTVDAAASGINRALRDNGIELYPPTTVILQR